MNILIIDQFARNTTFPISTWKLCINNSKNSTSFNDTSHYISNFISICYKSLNIPTADYIKCNIRLSPTNFVCMNFNFWQMHCGRMQKIIIRKFAASCFPNKQKSRKSCNFTSLQNCKTLSSTFLTFRICFGN